MKRLIVVLSSLLVLPAFAEVAPVAYDEPIAYNDAEVIDTAETVVNADVVQPVAQPSRATPRGSATANRAAARVVPSATSATNPRAISARNATSSRNATQARTGSTVASRAASARAAVRPSSQTVTSRRAVQQNNSVASRAATLTQTDTVNTPLYTGRVGVRSSSAIQARMPTAISISSNSATVATSTEEKADAITNMDELAQLTDYCKAQYTSCMDNFCNVLDDNQGRCSCSKNIKNYEKTENALKAATEALQDVAQQIQYIGLTGDDIDTLFTQTEAEIAMQSTTDSTQLKNDLDNIKDMIVGIKTGTATSSETGMSFDLSGLLDFNIDNTGFDLTGLFGGNNANTNSISNQRGEQLYKTAAARCKASVLTTCQAQGVDISVITNSYDLEIDKQCIAYERALIDSNDNMVRTVRNAKTVLQKARLMVAQQKNSYDLRGCVNALDSCMQDDFVCGTDYENCLDPTGKYIVNGEVVVGSAPGYLVNDDAADSPLTPVVQPTKGLYATWEYANASGSHAWSGANTSLAGYIADSISDVAVKETDENLVKYLQYKIGYVENNKTYGMCASVLNKCQNYTYSDGEFQNDNQVVREYLQRTLTQIKVAQDEIISSYAENCISDVNSCLSSNNYSAYSPNYAINACKAQIMTCMSVNGDPTENPEPDAIVSWVQNMNSITNSNSTESNVTYNLNGMARFATGYTPITKAALDANLDTPDEINGDIISVTTGYTLGALYWCYNLDNKSTECIRTTTGIVASKVPGALLIGKGMLYLSNANSEANCTANDGVWTEFKGCKCPSGKRLENSGLKCEAI